jgi:2-dehydropantoate 2-reductase
MRVAVFGAGGVGGYFGGRLAQAGERVVFVARGAHLAAIRDEGLRVESIAGDFRVQPAEATDDPRETGPVDLVLVGVKAWQVPDAARAMRPLLRADTIVLPLQNGVEAPEQLAAEIGWERVVPGLCRLVAYLAAPGFIRHAGMTPRIEFGERDGRASARVDALVTAFERCVGVSVVVPPDVVAALWEKFLFIAPFSGVGAVARRPAGALRGVPETRALLQGAMQEVFEVARARGVRIGEDAVARTMGFVDALPADATASMQRDVMEGRASELESQVGAVVRLGRAAGVATPIHAFLHASLLPQERAARERA